MSDDTEVDPLALARVKLVEGAMAWELLGKWSALMRDRLHLREQEPAGTLDEHDAWCESMRANTELLRLHSAFWSVLRDVEIDTLPLFQAWLSDARDRQTVRLQILDGKIRIRHLRIDANSRPDRVGTNLLRWAWPKFRELGYHGRPEVPSRVLTFGEVLAALEVLISLAAPDSKPTDGPADTHETVALAASIIRESPGLPGKTIAERAGCSPEHFRRSIVPKLKTQGFYNSDGYRPPKV